MRVSREHLMQEATATGFRPEMLEKVIHLLTLLDALRQHPFLAERWVLKGGTALNLFVFDLPRLSIDLDINYIGAADREMMLAERPKVEQAITAVCQREGFNIQRLPDEHAGGKWHLRYDGALGQGGNLALDINFLLRVPLWPIVTSNSCPVGTHAALDIPVLDPHELAAGKFAALFTRHAARDLFDAHQLLTQRTFNIAQLRLGMLLYGAMGRTDWRTVSIDHIGFEARELEHQLIPVLSASVSMGIDDTATWARQLVAYCQERFAALLPLTTEEREFLDRLLDAGEIVPALVTDDGAMQARILAHPAIQWKAINVRQMRSRSGG